MNGIAAGLFATGFCFLIAGIAYGLWVDSEWRHANKSKLRLSAACVAIGFAGIIAGIWTAVLA